MSNAVMYLQEESEGEEFEGGAVEDEEDEIDEEDAESGDGMYQCGGCFSCLMGMVL